MNNDSNKKDLNSAELDSDIMQQIKDGKHSKVRDFEELARELDI